MDPNVRLGVDQGELLSSPNSYKKLVGKINYLIITSPDIAFAVSVVSQFILTPRSTRVEVALRIVRYLKVHPDRGFFYGVHDHLRIEAFTDAYWAGSPSYKRSTTGYCTFLGGNLVTLSRW